MHQPRGTTRTKEETLDTGGEGRGGGGGKQPTKPTGGGGGDKTTGETTSGTTQTEGGGNGTTAAFTEALTSAKKESGKSVGCIASLKRKAIEAKKT